MGRQRDGGPMLDMAEVEALVARGITPTCPDCGEALTKVPCPGARLPFNWEAPDPRDHRCDPERLARLAKAAESIGLPGETRMDAALRREREAEQREIAPTADVPPAGDEEDV